MRHPGRNVGLGKVPIFWGDQEVAVRNKPRDSYIETKQIEIILFWYLLRGIRVTSCLKYQQLMPVEAQVLMSEPPSSSCLANITFPAASKVADLSPYWPSINIWIQDPSAVRKAGEQISREMYTEMCSIGRVVTPVGTWYHNPTRIRGGKEEVAEGPRRRRWTARTSSEDGRSNKKCIKRRQSGPSTCRPCPATIWRWRGSPQHTRDTRCCSNSLRQRSYAPR